MNNRVLMTLIAAFGLMLTTGCSRGPELHDSIDLELDFELTPSDELHLPYVTGATVTISATDGDADDPSDETWTLASSDSSILRIDSQTAGSANCTAVSAGVTTVTVVDVNGQRVHEAEIEVVDPDHAVLYAHGPLIVGFERPIVQPEINVLAGGTATLLVNYYRGDRRLYGHGALSTVAPAGIDSNPVQTFLFEDREWLQITPSDTGDYEIPFSAGGIGIGALTVHAVDADAVARVELAHEYQLDLSDVEENSELVVLGVARDDANRAVYGVEFSWDLDGDGVAGLGDLFRYPYKPDVDATLGAEFDGLRAETVVHADSGYVGSSNQLGCNAGGTGGKNGLWLLAGIGIAWLASRRRR